MMVGMTHRFGLITSVAITLGLSACPGDDTSDDGGNGGSSTSASAESTDEGGETTDATTTGGASGGQDSSGGSSDGGESGTTAATGDSDDSTDGDSGSTDSGDTGETGGSDQRLCTGSGGTWDDGACGHYMCGVPNPCEALIPGCDCGPTSNFVDGMGCVEDDECAGMFACGEELECSLAGQYCEVFFPGVKGAPVMYTCQAIPAACAAMPDCQCLEDNDAFPPLAGSCMGNAGVGLTVDIFAP